MSNTKIEFAVQMTCQSCVEAVEASLKNQEGVNSFQVDLKNGSVVVDSNLKTLEVQKLLESSGRKVAIKGYEGTAAVVIVDCGRDGIQGVVRFVQVKPNICVIDGTIDGLNPKTELKLTVHETGDISKGCDSVGDVLASNKPESRLYGDLGTVLVDDSGRASFRLEDNVINLKDLIGRGFVISDLKERLSCGIIARSAGLFQNPKMICACDGVSIWDEVKKRSVL